MIRSSLLLPLLLVAGGATAQARHDSNAPIDFAADRIELQDKANRALLTGHVVVRQSAMTLSAGRITVAYTGQIVDGSPQVSRLDAAGGVTVTRPDQNARSNYAVYDVDRRVVTMIGDVTVTQSGNVQHSQRVTISLDASGSRPNTIISTGGRVTGRFSVPQRAGTPAPQPRPSPGR